MYRIKFCIVSLTIFAALSFTSPASAIPKSIRATCIKRTGDFARDLQAVHPGSVKLRNCTQISDTVWAGTAAAVYWVFPNSDQCTGCWPEGNRPNGTRPRCAWRSGILIERDGKISAQWSPVMYTNQVERPECRKHPF